MAKQISFEEMKNLHKKLNREGYNICIGCTFENAATCLSDRVEYCNKQLSKYQQNPKTFEDLELKLFCERIDCRNLQ